MSELVGTTWRLRSPDATMRRLTVPQECSRLDTSLSTIASYSIVPQILYSRI